MPKSRQQKEVSTAQVADTLRSAKTVVFASYESLPVKELEILRRKAKESGALYTVIKKTLLARAMHDAGFSADPKSIKGNFATVISLTDEIAPAKVVAAFAKDHEAMRVLGGVLEGNAVDAAAINALAKLPSKQELLGQLVGTLQAPIGGFVNALAGNLRGLVTALSAIKDQKPA